MPLLSFACECMRVCESKYNDLVRRPDITIGIFIRVYLPSNL